VIQSTKPAHNTCASTAEDGWWRHQPWRFEPKRPSFNRTKHVQNTLASTAEDGWWRHQPWRSPKCLSNNHTERVQNTWLAQLKMVGGDTNHGVLRRSARHSAAQSVYKTLG